MPIEWYNRHSVLEMEEGEKKSLYLSILADKKPRFMIYIYPEINQRYQEYIRNTDKKCERAFNITIDELFAKPQNELTQEQAAFIDDYYRKMPVGISDCTMNIICRKFEDKFDGWLAKRRKEKQFNYHILRSDAEYTPQQYNQIKRLYEDYVRRTKDYMVYAKRERVDTDDAVDVISSLDIEFRNACDLICSNAKSLCNILLDICYEKGSNKRFVWALCGKEIIDNLLQRNGHTISFPVQDPEGDFEFAGKRFRMTTKTLEV